jgi:hypothetical protein
LGGIVVGARIRCSNEAARVRIVGGEGYASREATGGKADVRRQNLHDLSALQRALDLFHAMLENPTLFVEPYLHQLMTDFPSKGAFTSARARSFFL